MSIPVSCKINRLFENNIEKCEWHIKGKIGSGKQATVYKACCDNEEKCNYAVKIYERVREDIFTNEVDIHYRLTELKLAVPIKEAFYCEEHGAYIIMERRDMNVAEYIYKLLEDNLSDNFIRNQIEKLRIDCINLVLNAYDNNIEQSDANILNFLLDKVGNNYTNICMTDFAHAKIFGNGIKPEYNREVKKDDVSQTIDLLIKDYESRKRNLINIKVINENKKKSRVAPSILSQYAEIDKRQKTSYNDNYHPSMSSSYSELNTFDSPVKISSKLSFDSPVKVASKLSFDSPVKSSTSLSFDSPVKSSTSLFNDVPETPKKAVYRAFNNVRGGKKLF